VRALLASRRSEMAKARFVRGLFLLGVLLIAPRSAQAQATCADPARTIMLSGPAACRVYDEEPAQCALAWATTQGSAQPVSCFYSSSTASCQGCGPTNQASGACVNACVAVARPAPALSTAALVGLFGVLALGGAAGVRSRRSRS
jgi:hypothetical protein